MLGCLNRVWSKTDFGLKNLWPPSIENFKHDYVKQSLGYGQCLLLVLAVLIFISQRPLTPDVFIMDPRIPWLKRRGMDFACQGTSGNVWRQFWLSRLGEGILCHWPRTGGSPGCGSTCCNAQDSPPTRMIQHRGQETLFYDNPLGYSGNGCPAPSFPRPEFCLNSHCYCCCFLGIITAWTKNIFFSDLLHLQLLNTWSLKMPFTMSFMFSIINGVKNVYILNVSLFNPDCQWKPQHTKATHYVSGERLCQLVGCLVFY